MSVKFCVVSMCWPVSPSVACSRALPLAAEGVFKRDISRLDPGYITFTEELLRLLREKYLSDTEKKPSIWTKLAIVTLALDKKVFCIDFILKNPSEAHVVHISRIEKEDVPSTVVYEHHCAFHKFLLPIEIYSEKNTFDLSKLSISKTLEGLSVDHDLVNNGLKCMLQDRKMEGIALTIAEGTFVWLKGAHL